MTIGSPEFDMSVWRKLKIMQLKTVGIFAGIEAVSATTIAYGSNVTNFSQSLAIGVATATGGYIAKKLAAESLKNETKKAADCMAIAVEERKKLKEKCSMNDIEKQVFDIYGSNSFFLKKEEKDAVQKPAMASMKKIFLLTGIVLAAECAGSIIGYKSAKNQILQYNKKQHDQSISVNNIPKIV